MLENKSIFERIAVCLAVVLISFFLFGMGGSLGEKEPTKIPEPEDNFSAMIIDQFDVSSTVSIFSIDGLTFISGKRGKANISIPFKTITSIDFYKKGGDLSAFVKMKDGAEIELKIDEDNILYGRLPYGILSVDIIDVKRVVIMGLEGHEK